MFLYQPLRELSKWHYAQVAGLSTMALNSISLEWWIKNGTRLENPFKDIQWRYF